VRRWRVREAQPEASAALARDVGIDRVTAQCLLNRGLHERTEARAFLRDGLGSLLRPEDLPDMPQGVDRIRRALRDRETICVWGDYDVDGISGTALLVRFLRLAGAERVIPHIPERTGSGYGFHWPTMERLIRERGVSLFVSVDHGSTAVDEVAHAAEHGVDVVIADHHEIAPQLPAAVAVINPKRSDSAYGFPNLCGAGVAMKLAWGVAQKLSPGARVTDEMREFLLEALGSAVLGTVADVVPLRGENRIIVRHGLKVLDARVSPGVSALLDVAGVRGALRATDIGFKLGPRLNAAGRMGNASLALELLLTDDTGRAREIAQQLDKQNEQRRAVEREVVAHARELARSQFGERPRGGIALHGERWHHGVIGIVAARLVEEFHVPVVLVSTADGVGRGSARSVPGFALHEALAACSEHLVAHGGHAAAAGLTIEPDRFPGFQDAFHRYVEETLPDDARVPELVVDADVALPDLDLAVAAGLERLEPFGAGNPEPVLAVRDVQVVGSPRRMGRDLDHVAFHVGERGRALRCIAFRRAAELAPLLEPGTRVDVALTPQRNTFRGATDVEGLVRDLRPATEPDAR
jgi:single-stranded-DNA-specific exonuclease